MKLQRGDIALVLMPQCGGSIARFAVGDIDIFRPVSGDDPTPLDLSCFPLVPFSGRIAGGKFLADGQPITLPVNFREEPLHAIHGHGWQKAWHITAHDAASATMRFDYEAGDWPWDYCAQQSIHLRECGYRHTLSIENLGHTPMPAGLGLHPYFPKAGASIDTHFSTRWAVGQSRLPTVSEPITQKIDWFGGTLIDTGFDSRSPSIELSWPTHSLTITPGADLNHTVIYIPLGEDYFCVEPVSHVANAINTGGMRWLAPNEVWTISVDFSVTRGEQHS